MASPNLAFGCLHVVQLSQSLGQPAINRRGGKGALTLRPRQHIVAVSRLQVVATTKVFPLSEKLLKPGDSAGRDGDGATPLELPLALLVVERNCDASGAVRACEQLAVMCVYASVTHETYSYWQKRPILFTKET